MLRAEKPGLGLIVPATLEWLLDVMEDVSDGRAAACVLFSWVLSYETRVLPISLLVVSWVEYLLMLCAEKR